MQRSQPLPLAVFAALMLAAAGCGNSSSSTSSAATAGSTTSSAATASPGATPSTTRTADAATTPPAHLTLSSPVFQTGRQLGPEERAIPARYTCDGSNTSPPLRWSGVPPATRELVLLTMDLSAPGSQRVFVWSIGRISPRTRNLIAGRVPPGAVMGRNSAGQRYSVCPARGRPHGYGIFLFALKHPLGLRAGFDPNSVYEKLGSAGLPEGQSGFPYKRS